MHAHTAAGVGHVHTCSSESQGWWPGLRQVMSVNIMATLLPRGRVLTVGLSILAPGGGSSGSQSAEAKTMVSHR